MSSTDLPIVLFVGIDPGSKGAIVAINRHLATIVQERLPWQPSHGLQLPQLIAILKQIKDHASNASGRAFIGLEFQAYRPTDGGKGIFTTGRGFGQLEGVIASLGFSYDLPRPSKGAGWHNVLDGIEGGDTKAKSIALCQRRLPDLNLTPGKTRTPQDGLADAGAIALAMFDRWSR